MLLEHLSQNMLLEPPFIEMVANSASKRYKETSIKKKDGSDRIIHQPARELKAIQRVIHNDILSKLPVHTSVYAYRKGINLKNHALAHRKGNFITRLDFRNFFNSIDAADIRKYITNNYSHIDSKWSHNDTELLVKLVCFKGALTIGSPTSPALSNCICHQLDEKTSIFCCEHNISYTRYADDLYFSTIEQNLLFSISHQIIKILRAIDYPKNLWLNKKKTIHSSKKHLRKVTGLVLTPEGNISLGRDKKRMVRSLIFKWSTLSDDERLSLKGYLAFISSVEPDFINRLCRKYGSKKVYDIIKYEKT